MNRYANLMLGVLTTLSIVGCKPPSTASTASHPQSLSSTSTASLSNPSDSFVKVDNPNFTVYYSKERNTPAFVVEALTAANISQKIARVEEFSTDTRVQSYGTKAYSRSGYDRGHMAAAANQTDQSMAASNLLSNIVPQTPDSNRKSWRELEEATRSIVEKQSGITYVISGVIGELSHFPVQYGDPYLLNNSKTGKNVRDAIYPPGLKNAGIAIPAYLYKIRIHNGQIQEVSVTSNCKQEGTFVKDNPESFCYTKNLGILSYGSDINKFLQDYSAWDNSYAPAFKDLTTVLTTLTKKGQ